MPTCGLNRERLIGWKTMNETVNQEAKGTEARNTDCQEIQRTGKKLTKKLTLTRKNAQNHDTI